LLYGEGFATFLSEIEKEFGVVLNNVDLLRNDNLESLVKLIAHKEKKVLSSTAAKFKIKKGPIAKVLLFLSDLLMEAIFKTYFKLKVHGDIDQLRLLNNFILIANHTSHLDTFILYRLLNRSQRNSTYVAAAKDYFLKNKILELVFTHIFNFVSFDRKSNFNEGLDTGIDVLKRGYNLIVYPEGTRSLNGEIGKFKNGIGYLVSQSSCTVLPIFIQNSFELWPKGSLFPKPGTINVNVLSSVVFNETDKLNAIDKVAYITNTLEKKYSKESLLK
jgi:long-chain acyl-CoA synthetase